MPTTAHPDPRRWKALVFIGLAQLMVVLDGTIVNVALPSVQHDLGMTDSNRQWVITAYALAYGGLLLLGGRVADLWGRKRTFLTGLTGFALASTVGGSAQSELMMFGGRALQGVFGALLVPSALSLLAVMFTDPKERAKAFGIYGAIAGGGGAVGLILGGFLTEYFDWRWTFFVNVPIAVMAALGAYAVIREPTGSRNRSPLDIPGVLLSTLGLGTLVYGFTRTESTGWTETTTLATFAVATVLLLTFVLVEARVGSPLLPLRVLKERNRAGAYVSLGLAFIALFATFLFVTYYLQIVKGFTPLQTGLAFLPASGGMVIGSMQIGARLMLRTAPRLLMAPGFLLAAAGMLLLTRLTPDSSYVLLILPAQLMLGTGLGTALMPGISLATHQVEPRHAGVASAMVTTSQQVGGAVGTTLLNSIAAAATAAYLTAHTAGSGGARHLQEQALVHGYTRAFRWAAAALVVSALITTVCVTTMGRARGRHRRTRHRPDHDHRPRHRKGDPTAPAPPQDPVRVPQYAREE
ncbi:MFS transporter [Streptomyces sp. B-S-A8]|uniref:MFS transporter n=1 Tax=Streptomyces solicavernae TaxID=3043614 RepID=A0ABT6S266_9ACTN|nr:MFS transporter [Streptomyces sp. B-S-A8]MDI3390786.1 MFS transporter [Streptomyces sp. B-S-A8]